MAMQTALATPQIQLLLLVMLVEPLPNRLFTYTITPRPPHLAQAVLPPPRLAWSRAPIQEHSADPAPATIPFLRMMRRPSPQFPSPTIPQQRRRSGEGQLKKRTFPTHVLSPPPRLTLPQPRHHLSRRRRGPRKSRRGPEGSERTQRLEL